MTMKLYVSPGACSMSCHIAFEEAKLPFEAMVSKKDEVAKLNPQGAVPVLVLDDGKVLTQNIAILTYAAAQAPQANLLPKTGTWEFYQAYQWLSWVASDLHPTIGELYDKSISDEDRAYYVGATHELLEQAEAHMNGKTYLAGEQFTVADMYFFAVYGWTRFLNVPNEKYRNLNAYAARIAERPAVQAVFKREGLKK
jgi:glutathione S-transferase